MKNVLPYLGVLILLSSCSPRKQDIYDEMPRLYPPPNVTELNLEEGYKVNPVTGDSIFPIINREGDTVPTGVMIKAKGEIIFADNVPPPDIFPAGKPSIVPMYQNIHKIPDQLTVVPFPDSLWGNVEKIDTYITTNHYKLSDTIITGIPIEISGTEVPCTQPEPMGTTPPLIKDNAIYEIRYLDMSCGLSSNYITALMKDSRGYIWIGTEEKGILRYDGHNCINYTTVNGLNGMHVRSMIEDSKGNIWIGTTDNGASMFDGVSFTHFTSKEGFKGNDIRMIMEDHNGYIWFAVYGTGICRYNSQTFTNYSPKEGFPGYHTFSIFEDSRNNLWIGALGHVRMFDGTEITGFDQESGFAGWHNTVIYEDNCGNIWFGNIFGVDDKLICFNGKAFTHFTVDDGLSDGFIYTITGDSHDHLWIGTGSGGLNTFNGKYFTHITNDEGLKNNSIHCLLNDQQGNLWIGTHEGGLNILRNNGFEYIPIPTSWEGDNITSIKEDHRGNIWYSTDRGGVGYNDGVSFYLFNYDKGLNRSGIRTILEDSKGNLWMGSVNNGVTMYDGKNFYKYRHDLHPLGYWDNSIIYEDSRGRIWFGSDGSAALTCFDGTTYTQYTEEGGFTFRSIGSITEDSKGNIWFGTRGAGVIRLHGDSMIHYTEKEGLSDNHVTSVFEDTQGNLWIGTRRGGVNIFDGKNFIHITIREGLNDNCINNIVEDSLAGIWLSTPAGLNRVSLINGIFAPVIYSFNQEDMKIFGFNSGTRGSFDNVLLDSRNRIWWGTHKGFIMLDMKRFQLPFNPPEQVGLNRLDINGQFIDYRHIPDSLYAAIEFDTVLPFHNYPLSLEIPYNMNHLTFHLSALDWAAPHKVRYSYKVEGLDKGWSAPSAESRVDYRNIPHGRYTFRVCAIGAAQKWSEPFEYSFRIRPPWWFSWWAYNIYGLMLVSMIFLYRRFLLKRASIKAEVKIERIEKEKILEIDRMKSRFFANVSHEFRTPLTLILGPVENMLKKKTNAPEQKEDLRVIHRSARRLQELINQLLDISKLETGQVRLEVVKGDLSWWIRTIILSFLSLAESMSIKYEHNIPETPGEVFFDRDKIEKILTNLVSNAFKFTPDGGDITVTVKYLPAGNSHPEHSEITVRDSGKGIEEDQLEKIFDRFYQVQSYDSRSYEGTGIGISFTKELVEIYRGEIRVESKPGKGSVFSVILPVARKKFKEDELIDQETERVETAETSIIEVPDDHEITSKTQQIPVLDKDSEHLLILVVEDNEDLRKYIASNLDDTYRLIEARNGNEGLEVALESIPDLIITDLMMPEMDGIELCSKIRDDDRISHIPVIMLTAKAGKETKLEGLKTGADDYLVKPFDVDELRVRVSNLIQLRKDLREKYQKEFIASDPFTKKIADIEDVFLERAIECIKKHLDEQEFNVEKMAGELGCSRSQLHRKLSSLTGYVPNQFIRNIRLKQAARMFNEGATNITQVVYTVGFNSPSSFSRYFHEFFGVIPSEYLKNLKSGSG